MRKRNLEFRAVHLRNLENFLRWIAYNSDAVTGCINVSLLCVEIHREIWVSKSTIYLMIKELVIMRVLVDAEWSGQGCQDIRHGGCLPRTICATPFFYELLGIYDAELKRLRTYETERRCEKKQKVTMRRAHFGNIVKTTYGECGNIDIPRRIQVTG
ncbi:hypothetical protein [Candidatus Enterovibrio escicola]|uniref:hypothetical protein n=1 Tax=Candidatus Enterovibrio escicola TaxID=1927127 RepID=UPI001237F8DC|nr:hypothetical protein [Candidatus Enterovibrio escacola]